MFSLKVDIGGFHILSFDTKMSTVVILSITKHVILYLYYRKSYTKSIDKIVRLVFL